MKSSREERRRDASIACLSVVAESTKSSPKAKEGQDRRESLRPRVVHEQKTDEDLLEEAVQYFKTVPEHTPYKGNKPLKNQLDVLQNIAFRKGLPPEAIDTLLNVAMSSKLADLLNIALLKCLIPFSTVPDKAVVDAVSWMCTAKPSTRTKVVFLRWLVTVFDLIEHKEQLHALYGIFFFFLQDEKLCPYICHMLYLLTVRERVKPFRVRKLLELQSRKGKQPYLQALLALYKVFCPELISLSLPTNHKTYFKNLDNTWKAAIRAVQLKNKRNGSLVRQPLLDSKHPAARKRKWNSNANPPLRSKTVEQSEKISFLSRNKVVPVEQLHSFSDLLDNIYYIEFPAQMGSVLTSPLMLHYLSCVKEESALLRLNFWLGHVLDEEFPWIATEENEQQYREFLTSVFQAQEVLQEGLSSTEKFLYRLLQRWDGSCCRSQILLLLSQLPIITDSEMKALLFEPLKKLFFTSSIYLKCGIFESLNKLLENWLTQHSVYSSQADARWNTASYKSSNAQLHMLMYSVIELVEFVGELASLALMMEEYSVILMYFILTFYETTSDLYLKYNLPLVLLLPPAVFFPALLSTECFTLNMLCFIMNRYRANLVSAKERELNKELPSGFTVNNRTFKEYNLYVSIMVNCLWLTDPFSKDIHPLGIDVSSELLEEAKVPEFHRRFNIVYHPALVGHAVSFLQQGWPEEETLDLSSVKGKRWNWYEEYLYSQGLDGLKVFIESSIRRRT